MINKFSTHVIEKLISNGTIGREDKELYVYGLFMLLSQFMFFIFICFFGIFFHCFVESIIFYTAFQFIRRYAGGYHASTEIRCEIMSVISLLICVIIIRLSQVFDFRFILIILSGLSAVSILILCPLDTPEKSLSEKEHLHFRKLSLLTLFFIIIVSIISYILKFNYLFVPCCLSLLLEGFLIVAGKIKLKLCKPVNK